MGEEVYDEDKYHLTAFYGGTAQGPCIQVTDPDGHYAQIPLSVLSKMLPVIQKQMESLAHGIPRGRDPDERDPHQGLLLHPLLDPGLPIPPEQTKASLQDRLKGILQEKPGIRGKLDAVHLLRDETGLDIPTSKAAVDRIEQSLNQVTCPTCQGLGKIKGSHEEGEA